METRSAEFGDHECAYDLDTTTLTDGLHQMNVRAADGAGSRQDVP